MRTMFAVLGVLGGSLVWCVPGVCARGMSALDGGGGGEAVGVQPVAPSPSTPPASTPPAGDQPLVQDPRHLIGELENGLRYVIVQHMNPPDRGLVWLHVNAGSLNEADSQRGAARLVQRLAFAGSKNYAGQMAVATLLQSIGSQPNIDALSHSTFEETVFKLALRDATPKTVGDAVAFLADIPADLAFADADIERERGTIIEQMKLTSNPESRIQDQIWKRIAPGSKFGERTPDVPEAAVKALTREASLAYYQQWYAPSNMTLIVASGMESEAVLEVVKAKFGGLAKRARPAAVDVGIKPYDKPFGLLALEPEMKQTQVYMFRLVPPHPPTRTESQLRAKLVQAVAIGAFNRRLNEKISSGKVAFTGGSALAVDLSNVSTLVAINATTEVANWKQTLDSIGTEVQRARLHGLLESDIEAVKKQYTLSAEQGVKQESTKVLGTVIGGIAATVNNGDVYMSAEQTLGVISRLLPALTKSELDEAFRTLFDPSSAAFVMATSGGAGTPTEDELLRAGIEAFKATPSAEAAGEKPTALMTTMPTPGKVAKETIHEKTGVQTWVLDNGVVVNYLNLPVPKEAVNVTISLAGGLIQETPENHGITEAASLVLNRPATTKLTAGAIQELLQGKEVRMQASSGVDAVVIGMFGKTADIESGFQLAHLVLTDPFIEPPVFSQWRTDARAAATDGAKAPQAVFNRSVHEALFPESEFRLRPLSEKEIDAVSIESATRWLKQILASSPIEVSIVGDLTKEEATRLVTTYVGSLAKRSEPGVELFRSARTLSRPQGERAIDREVDSPNQTAYLMLGFYGADESAANERRALFIARAILDARLNRSLRDTDQLVQGVQVRFDPGQEFPGFGLFRAMAPVAADKIEPVAKRIMDTFKSFAEVGPTPEELEGIRAQAIKSLEDVQKDPGYWTGELSMLRMRGKSLDDAASERTSYERITLADVKGTFAKYFGAGTTLRVVLRPKPVLP